MKPYITLLASIIFICFANPASPAKDSDAQQQSYVYICTGSSSTKYHKTSSCRGLGNCKGSVKKVSKEEAQRKYHRTACKLCYR